MASARSTRLSDSPNESGLIPCRHRIADEHQECGRLVFMSAVRDGGVIVAEVYDLDEKDRVRELSTPAAAVEYLDIREPNPHPAPYASPLIPPPGHRTVSTINGDALALGVTVTAYRGKECQGEVTIQSIEDDGRLQEVLDMRADTSRGNAARSGSLSASAESFVASQSARFWHTPPLTVRELRRPTRPRHR